MDNVLSKKSAIGRIVGCWLGLFLVNEAWASQDQERSGLLWLLTLPDWTLLAMLAIVFTGLAVLSIWMINKIRTHKGQDKFKLRYGVISGAIVGLTFGFMMADVWNQFVLQHINQIAPTAAGRAPRAIGLTMDLLEPADPSEDAQLQLKAPKKVVPGRARHVKANLDALVADNLNLDLFGDTFLIAKRDRIDSSGPGKGKFVWVGHIEGDPDSQVILAAKGKALMGTVTTEGRHFEIVYAGGSTHAVREINPNQLPEQYEPENLHELSEEIGLDVSGDTVSSTSSTTFDISADVASTGEVIDLLVVYTPQALANAGSVDAMEAKVLNAVTQANQAYLNSGVNMSLNVVGIEQTNFTEMGDMSISLTLLVRSTEGYMDEVHGLRDQVGADQVVLLTTDTNYCGIAPIMNNPSTSFSPSAFAVVHDDSLFSCLSANNTLAHELGHNQGNVHNIESTSYVGAYPDSYGYRVCDSFHTIMSYPCNSSRIPYFSNPNVYWNGMAIGVEGSANTARSMNQTAPIVASFRTSTSSTTVDTTTSAPEPTVPAAPTGASANASSTETSIALSWTDNATDETGYKLERSEDGTRSLSENSIAVIISVDRLL